jgi:hypothetical protein
MIFKQVNSKPLNHMMWVSSAYDDLVDYLGAQEVTAIHKGTWSDRDLRSGMEAVLAHPMHATLEYAMRKLHDNCTYVFLNNRLMRRCELFICF